MVEWALGILFLSFYSLLKLRSRRKYLNVHAHTQLYWLVSGRMATFLVLTHSLTHNFWWQIVLFILICATFRSYLLHYNHCYRWQFFFLHFFPAFELALQFLFPDSPLDFLLMIYTVKRLPWDPHSKKAIGRFLWVCVCGFRQLSK